MSNIQLNPTNAENLDIEINGSSVWSNVSAVVSSDNLSATNDFTGGTGSGVTDYLYANQFNLDLEEGTPIHGFEIVIERKGVGSISDYYVGLVYPDGGGIAVTDPGKQLAGNWPLTDTPITYGGGEDTFNRTWTVDEVNHNDFGFVISVEGDPSNLDAALIDHISLVVYYAGAMSIEASGGSTCGGAADVSSSCQRCGGGGISCGGSHKIIHNIDGSGGVEHGGNGEYSLHFYPVHSDHRVMATGKKAIPSTNTNKMASAEFHVHGKTLSWNINHNLTSLSIIQIRGPASEAEVAPPLVYVGTLSGRMSPVKGSTILSSEDAAYIAEGRAYLYMEDVAPEDIVRAQITDTSMKMGGSADMQFVYNPVGQRQSFDFQAPSVQLSILSHESFEEGSGGAEMGGAAEEEFFDYVAGNGGAGLGGEAKATPFIEEGSGGLTAGGEAKATPFIEEGAGGIEAGGEATGAFYLESSTGGLVANGTAPFVEINFEVGSGGAECGGTSPTVATYDIEVSGGSVHGGVADVQFVDEVEGTGGAVVNGGAIFFAVFTEEVGGGIECGGQITTAITPFHEGGAEVSGAIDKEQVIFQPVFEGEAAVLGGTASVTFIDQVAGEGGAVVAPAARIEYIRFFTSVKNKNAALALKSDNIVKTAFIEGLQGEQIVQRFPIFGVVPAPDPEDVEGIRFDPAAVWCDFDEPVCPENGAFLTDLTQSNQGEDNIPPKDRGAQPRDRTIARLS